MNPLDTLPDVAVDNRRTINILIIHGVEGYPDKNWYKQLQAELEKAYGDQVKFNFIIPQFPTKLPEEGKKFIDGEVPEDLRSFDKQSAEYWLPIAQEALKGCAPEDTIIVAHSAGGGVGNILLQVAAKLGIQYRALIGVCSVCEFIHLPDECDPSKTATFYEGIDPKMVRKGAKEIGFVVGEGDTDVPRLGTLKFAEACGADWTKTIEKGKHINYETDPDVIKEFLRFLCHEKIGPMALEMTSPVRALLKAGYPYHGPDAS